jgi:hypothetical protein
VWPLAPAPFEALDANGTSKLCRKAMLCEAQQLRYQCWRDVVIHNVEQLYLFSRALVVGARSPTAKVAHAALDAAAPDSACTLNTPSTSCVCLLICGND